MEHKRLRWNQRYKNTLRKGVEAGYYTIQQVSGSTISYLTPSRYEPQRYYLLIYDRTTLNSV